MGTLYEGPLDLDASTNPHQLNMNFAAGPEKGNVNLCIYEITGDIWKLSIATRGSVRPSTFISAPGTDIAIEIRQRVKPSAQYSRSIRSLRRIIIPFRQKSLSNILDTGSLKEQYDFEVSLFEARLPLLESILRFL
jgi:hypothetical protein